MTEVGVQERYARRVIVITAIATCSTPTSSRLLAVHSATVDCCTVVDGRTPSQTISPLAGSVFEWQADGRKYFAGQHCMKNVTRRSFVSSAAAGVTALGLFGNTSHAAEAQLVWKASEWKLAEFHKLIRDPTKSSRCMTSFRLAKGHF